MFEKTRRSGQSLIELLIAIVVGVAMLIGAATVIAPALKNQTTATRLQVSTALGRELLDNVRVLAESDWPLVTALTAGPGTTYFLNVTSSPFTISTGTESIVIATTTFTRYFYIENVGRAAGGYISGAATDPSTKQVTVVSGLSDGPTSSLSTYIMRTRNSVWHQTDWSGGPNQEGPASTTNNRFASSSANLSYASTTGSILINL